LWNTDQPNVAEGLQKTLDALGTVYLDLYVNQPSSPFGKCSACR
jgi:diketogulonate reductase-like aldo/keto reductase